MTPKDEMIKRIKFDGYDPGDFTCTYLRPNLPNIPLDKAPNPLYPSLLDLPEHIEEFSCRNDGIEYECKEGNISRT